MKLASLHIDRVLVIPGAAYQSGGPSVVREQSFTAEDGWDLREVLPGIFSIHGHGMREPAQIGGVGYSFVRAKDLSVEHDAQGDPAMTVSGFETLDGQDSKKRRKR